jgi:hypothetical protein
MMAAIDLTGEVVYPMGPKTRALKLDTPEMARRFRSWCQGLPNFTTKIATVTSITGPDDGGVPLVYYGAKALVARSKAGDRATIRVEDRPRRNGRGLETVDLQVL